MKQDHDRTRDLLACLGHGSRYRIVERLSRDPRCVSDLARDVSLSQSCTTRHLQALQRAGLVCGTRAGKRVMFRLCLDDPQVDALIGWAMAERPAAAKVASARDRAASSRRPRFGQASSGRLPAPDSAPPAPPSDPAPAAAAPTRPGGPEADPGEEAEVPRWRPDDLEDFLL